jgi:GntR family transcriptional regulator, transcriptional repressor for pyruvate dehydrogenase complex
MRRVAGMEHKGLVSRVEEDLERTIALGRSGRGSLPSEREMAKRYGVSRTTIRGALQGLAARGLIIRHPGRKSRTVALDQALTLESLKLALPEEGHTDPGRRRLLEGFFALKREVTVELLAACCEHASDEDLKHLAGEYFSLREEARWQEDRRSWVRKEFELLRLAARTADRPGHVLLIQSLEKAFRGLSDRVLPHLDGEALCQWALFAFDAVFERNVQALRDELPARLKAVDAALLDHLAPDRESRTPPAPSPASALSLAAGGAAVSGADRPNRYACHTSFPPGKPDPRGMKRGSLPVALAQRPARPWCSASPYTSLTRSPVSTPNCRHAAQKKRGASTRSRLPRHGLHANAANRWR